MTVRTTNPTSLPSAHAQTGIGQAGRASRMLEARGVAGAVGLLGEPLRADWVLTLSIDAPYNEVATPPGVARLALSALRQRLHPDSRSFAPIG